MRHLLFPFLVCFYNRYYNGKENQFHAKQYVTNDCLEVGLIMEQVKILCHIEVYTLQDGIKGRPIRLMSLQDIKHLYTHKQPLQDQENVVFSGVVTYPASLDDVKLPRESRKQVIFLLLKDPFIFQICEVPFMNKDSEINKAFNW